MKYVFENELIERLIIRRNNQFTLNVEIDGELNKVHCPTRGRIGNIDLKNIVCLLSKSNNPKRKTNYTLEAISLSKLNSSNKNWVGVNQIASNRYIEFFLKNNLLKRIIDKPKEIKCEVKLGNSKLDFKVENIYLEVKTPLQTLQIEYDSNIKTKTVKSFSSTDRFVKHINELTESLKDYERAILINTFQYDNPGYKIINKSTNYEFVKSNVRRCVENGLEMWQVNMSIDKNCVELIDYWKYGDEFFSKIL